MESYSNKHSEAAANEILTIRLLRGNHYYAVLLTTFVAAGLILIALTLMPNGAPWPLKLAVACVALINAIYGALAGREALEEIAVCNRAYLAASPKSEVAKHVAGSSTRFFGVLTAVLELLIGIVLAWAAFA